MLVYRAIFIVAVFIGAMVNLSFVWNIADIANALMAIPNMISLIFLSGIIAKETQKYLWEDRLDDTEEPNNDN